MMQNDILKGISQALNSEFGYPIYTDNIEQGLDCPCFIVTDLSSTDEHVVMDRHVRTYPFMIQYFPEKKDYRMECADVKDRLFDSLEYIMANDHSIMGTEMSGAVTDGVLNFEVTYKTQVFRIKRTDEELMENIDISQNVKE